MVFLVKNDIGYRNLLKLLAYAYLETDDADDASRRSGASWALNDDEYDGLVQKLRRAADGARVPIGALLKAAPRRCEAKLRHLLRDKDPGSATQRKRLGRAACRLRRALCHRARPSGSKKGLDLRELEDAEPELFEEGTLAAFRDCCARLAGCSSADADALFRLVDDDKDGALGRREVIEFVRDTGESWSRRAGLDAAARPPPPKTIDPAEAAGWGDLAVPDAALVRGWDLTLQKLLPHLDGTRTVASIAAAVGGAPVLRFFGADESKCWLPPRAGRSSCSREAAAGAAGGAGARAGRTDVGLSCIRLASLGQLTKPGARDLVLWLMLPCVKAPGGADAA